MLPMLPLCNSSAMLAPMNTGMMGFTPAMLPMMPIAGAPLLCPPNNFNMLSTTSTMSEYDSHMYGRFRHVEREHPRYRHAPFDWYKPPKQRHNIVHEDAAVVTLDGPVPIGDFYRYYIYGDGMDDNDEYDDDGSSSFTSEEYDDLAEPSSYEPRSVGYQRYRRTEPEFDNEDIDNVRPSYRPSMGASNYTTLNPNRRTAIPSAGSVRPSTYRGNRMLAGDDDLDDAASVNSTYGN